MKLYFYCISFIGLILFSCKSEIKKTTTLASEVNKEILLKLNSPSQKNSSLPKLFSNDNGLYMSWVENTDSLSILNYARYQNEQWSEAYKITFGADWFVNWADFPTITENNGTVLTHILQKSAPDTYTYDVKLNMFSEVDETLKNNILLHNDGTKSEHGFVSMLPYKENQFFITWLDGRKTVNVPKGKEQMTLRAAFISSEGKITGDTQIDNRICDCCQTSATQSNSSILVAYRDRSEEEVRDISVVRWNENNGWSKPAVIGNDNWKINGCPVNGPSIDAFNENVALAWFSGSNDNPRVQIAFSQDEGDTFGLPIRIDAGNAIGRVNVAMMDKNTAFVLWMEPKGNDTLIQLVKAQANGEMGKVFTVSKTRAERASGFPQLEIVEEKVYIAWTSLEEEKPQIKTVSLLIKNL